DDLRPPRARRPRPEAQRLRPEPLPRDAAAPVPRPRARPRSTGPAARRTCLGPRSAGPRRAPRAAPGAAQPRQDDPHQQPHPPGAVPPGHRAGRGGEQPARPAGRGRMTALVARLRARPPLMPGISAILVKDLRGRMRGRRAFLTLTVYLILLAGIGWMIERVTEQNFVAMQSCIGCGGQATFASASIGRSVFDGILIL